MRWVLVRVCNMLKDGVGSTDRNSPNNHCHLHVQLQSHEFTWLSWLRDFNSAVPHFAYLCVSAIDNIFDPGFHFGCLKIECDPSRPF